MAYSTFSTVTTVVGCQLRNEGLLLCCGDRAHGSVLAPCHDLEISQGFSCHSVLPQKQIEDKHTIVYINVCGHPCKFLSTGVSSEGYV